MADPCILRAAQRADLDALRVLLGYNVSATTSDQFGWTPLHCLCNNGDKAKSRLDCLRMLLEAGADIHAPDQYQSTPLHLAAGWGHAKVVAALIKAGADVNRGDNNNNTPLHQACLRDDSDVKPAKLLLRNGAAVNARDDNGDTPLDWAIEESNSRFFPTLLRAGAALPAQTDDAYIRKVIAAGGIRQYERIHLDVLTATFAPHFTHLPPEMVRRVVEYAFHVGDY